jgi:hypothetical protein
MDMEEKKRKVQLEKVPLHHKACAPGYRCCAIINRIHALIIPSNRHSQIQVQVESTPSNANCDDESLTDRLCEDPSLHYRCESLDRRG